MMRTRRRDSIDQALVLIGASAGGVEAVRDVVTALPADLDATVLVVVHIAANATSTLPEILSRSGSLPAAHAQDGDDLEPGRILVAPPDRHLVVQATNVRVTRDPKENNHRPSVDALFRSAAASHGPSVIGGVASGNLDDGTLGLIEIKAAGGATVAQDPDTAQFPSMPLSAITKDHIDHVQRPYAIAEVIAQFVSTGRHPPAPATADAGTIQADEPEGPPAPFTCPRCNGPLWETEHGDVLRYRCRVGHAWSEQAMHESQSDDVEEALWTAVRTLREKAAMVDRFAERATDRGLTRAARKHERHAAELRDHAHTIRGTLETLGGSAVALEHAR